MTTSLNAAGIGTGSTAAALEFFDQLDPAAVNDLIGSWRGKSFPTGHPLDDALEVYCWHGKRFEHAEHVHPLVFKTMNGGTASVNPLWALPIVQWLNRVPIPKSQAAGRIFQLCLGLMSTRRSCARLRLTHYRGKVSATMIYDTLPINDIFRKIDDDTMLGLMDLKGTQQPFFFVLHREPSERVGEQ
ncbi:hypothetical protein C7293_25855 [filamentous cyanobacterium CCT1]|nr:hypothetical protein C7293_25855 [filamentous cyanobacterium CCT1]PSN77025.1 hypothetical protein C8B47_24265 [filamentous cyanobacterium CCP4]